MLKQSRPSHILHYRWCWEYVRRYYRQCLSPLWIRTLRDLLFIQIKAIVNPKTFPPVGSLSVHHRSGPLVNFYFTWEEIGWCHKLSQITLMCHLRTNVFLGVIPAWVHCPCNMFLKALCALSIQQVIFSQHIQEKSVGLMDALINMDNNGHIKFQ